jgi:large subunit ribosomal protein MRP49
MTVKQTEDQSGPSALTIYFAEKAGSAANAVANESKVIDASAPAPAENEDPVVLDLKNRTDKQIWDRLQIMTNAKAVHASAEDMEISKKLQAIQAKSGPDRQRVQSIRQQKKDQERMLAMARGEVEKE